MADATNSTATPAATAGGSGEMCRLTIYGPDSRVELAVPAHVPISDLMPTVLGHLDPSLATSGLGHDGWVLQRLGESPLDEDKGTAAAGIFDGDVLHLRPRADQLPVADFDDLVDGVHTGLSARADRWRPELTRRACVALAVLCGLVSLLIVVDGTTGTGTAIGAGALGVVLLGAAVGLGRLLGDRVTAVAFAATGVVAIGVAGLAMPAAGAGVSDWFTGPGVLAATVAVAVAAVVARLMLDVGKPVFLAVTGGGVLVAAGATLGVLTDLGGPATAASVLAVCLVLTRVAPQLAGWLSGLVAEPVPTTPEEFQQGLDPLPSKKVLDQAALADVHLTAFLAVLGAVSTGALLVVVSAPRWDTVTLTAVVAALLLLHARELTGLWHRLAALAPAVVALVMLVIGWAAGLAPLGELGVLIGLLALAGFAVAGAQLLPGRRLVPRWGRVGDILQWLCALAVVPLLLSVAGVYGLAATWL